MFAAIHKVFLCKRFAQKFISSFNSFTVQTKEEKGDKGDKGDKEEYTYVFQVCGDADGMKDAGVVQRGKDGKQVLIGNYSLTQAVRGSE